MLSNISNHLQGQRMDVDIWFLLAVIIYVGACFMDGYVDTWEGISCVIWSFCMLYTVSMLHLLPNEDAV